MASSKEDEEGFTLVEVLIAVVILGVGIVVLLGGMATSVVTSDIHRNQATGTTVLVQAAEAIKDDARNPFRNADCTGTAAYNPFTGVTLPPGWAPSPPYQPLRISAVKYWNGTSFGSTCSVAYKLQQVTLEVTSPGKHSTSETVSIIKRGV